MVDEDFGEATIVYEDPDEGTVRRTVENEHVAYFQDHWILKTGEDDEGRDTIVRIPATRVYHVERTVQEFEAEISTLADQVRSLTADLRQKLPVGSEGRGSRARRERGRDRGGPVEIDVERGGESAEEGRPGPESGGS